MALREFDDEAGTRWIVWDTIPASTIGLTEEYRRGWLTFDSGTDRCRLAPIPPDWTELPIERLLLLLQVARTAEPTDTAMTWLENERRHAERREAQRRQAERRHEDRRQGPVTRGPA
jgi:hypothetical protein